MTSTITASVVASALVTVAPNANAAATNFKDVQSNAYFYEAVNSLHARNIISGYDDGTFRPNETLTRAQAAKIIALSLNLDTTNIKDPGFKDVSKKDWAYKYIAALANKGIVVASESEYKPNNPITRAQMAKIISLAYNFQAEDLQQLSFTDVNQDDWFKNFVGALVGNQITTGTTPTTFSPYKNVTRGQIAAFVYRSENKKNPVQVNETISNITNETLVTSEGAYILSDEQKKWINPSNLAALKGAILKLTSTDDKIKQIQSIELTSKGTSSTDTSNPYSNHVVFDGKGSSIDTNVIVNGDYITMKNITIKGDLHVSKGVENSFFSEFTKVEGKTTIDDSLAIASQTKSYKSSAVKAASTSFTVAVDEAATRGRVVFSEFQLGDVGIDKNAEVIFLSKTTGASIVGEIVVNSNATLTAVSSAVLPKVVIAQGATDVIINSNVTALQVTTTGNVKLSGKSNIANLSLKTNANVNLQTIGRVNNLETVKKETKVTIGTETKIGNLVIPTGTKPADIIGNYNSVKGNIEQVGGTKNPDTTPAPPSTGNTGSGSGSGSTDTTAPSLNPSVAPTEIQLINYATSGDDMIAVPYAPVGSTIKVYDASSNGKVIGSLSNIQDLSMPPYVLIPGGFTEGLDKVYVTITENGKSESVRVEKGVPTSFPNAPVLSDITVTDNASGEDRVTVKVPSLPSPTDEYIISIYDTSGKQLRFGYQYNEEGAKTIVIPDGFANGMTEIDVAIIKISDNRTQLAESLRTRVSLSSGTIEPLGVISLDDQFSNDKTFIIAGNLNQGNEFAYKVFDDVNAANAEKPTLNADVSTWTALPSDGKISAANGKVVVVVERTIAGKLAKKVGQVNAVTVVNNQLLEAAMIDGKDGVSSQDGEVETIRLKFSGKFDPVKVFDDNTFTVNGFTVNSIKVTDKNGRTPFLSDGITSNPLYTLGESQYITIRVIPQAGTGFTPTVTQNSPIKDINDVEITGINIQAVDQAAPVIVRSEFNDINSDGVNAGDQLTITFSEDVNPTSLAELADDFVLNNQANANFTFANDGEDQIEHLGNTVTVTLGATTANKLSQGTTITMNEVSSAISLFDNSWNKAKPQKVFVNETVYSDARTIDITNIPSPNINPITTPAASKAQGTVAGTIKLTGLTDGVTYEYIVDNNTTTSDSTDWTEVPLSGKTEIDNINVNASQYVHIRVASTGTQPASEVQNLQVEIIDIKPADAPTAVAEPAGVAGYTKLTGLVAGETYEYFVDNNEHVAYDAAGWSNAIPETIVFGDYIDNIQADSSQYIHIRIKATTEKPASYIKDVKGMGQVQGPENP